MGVLRKMIDEQNLGQKQAWNGSRKTLET